MLFWFNLVILACILTVAFLLIYLYLEITKNKKNSKVNLKRFVQISNKQKSDKFLDRVNCDRLKKRLLLMLNGDRGTYERLLKATQGKYPNKNQSWWLEKIIADLERDKR